jgi:hypothetical protein
MQHQIDVILDFHRGSTQFFRLTPRNYPEEGRIQKKTIKKDG